MILLNTLIIGPSDDNNIKRKQFQFFFLRFINSDLEKSAKRNKSFSIKEKDIVLLLYKIKFTKKKKIEVVVNINSFSNSIEMCVCVCVEGVRHCPLWFTAMDTYEEPIQFVRQFEIHLLIT